MAIKRLMRVLMVTSLLLVPLVSHADFADEKKLLSPDGATGAYDYFGEAVAISGNIAIVGASHERTVSGSNSGSAYVFVRDANTNEWTFHQKLLPSTGYTTGYFGGSVAISGDTAIIGAFGP